MIRMRHLLFPLLIASLFGCGGDEVAPGESEIRLSSSSSDYNGDSSNFSARLSRRVGRDDTTLTVSSGSREFKIVLPDDVLKKGQRFDLGRGDGRATYDEGSDKVWTADDGTAEVTEEVLGKFTIRLRDLRFTPKDDDGQALGDFEIDGTLVRR